MPKENIRAVVVVVVSFTLTDRASTIYHSTGQTPLKSRASRGNEAVRERFARRRRIFFGVFPSNGTEKRSRLLCTAGWERDGKVGRQKVDGMGWELIMSRWDGNGREIKRSGIKSENKSGNKLGNKSGNTSGKHVGKHVGMSGGTEIVSWLSSQLLFFSGWLLYLVCCDSGIQGHTNGSTRRTCTSSKNSIKATNVMACVVYRYIVI